ncbi:MAG TPA: metallophosphoesterase [Nitrospira sp.]|nr:metallophosphoesterase [Nitrospira sp.]
MSYSCVLLLKVAPRLLILCAAVLILLGGYGHASDVSDPIIVAVGDIACPTSGNGHTHEVARGDVCRQMETSDLVLQIDELAAVLTLGDNQYPTGALTDFQNSYDRSWGRVKAMTHPSIGNHEGLGDGYYTYFGDAAGPRDRGYYSFDIGAWHVIALNSNSECQIVACDQDSAQLAWLREDLVTHQSFCTLAYWHHPRFSSGRHRNANVMSPIWKELYASGVDLVLSGHDHDYERFAPLDADGRVDKLHGIRSFVVGTGGARHTDFSTIKSGSKVRNSDTFGILKLTLHPTSYEWEFVPEAGKIFTDKGNGRCH